MPVVVMADTLVMEQNLDLHEKRLISRRYEGRSTGVRLTLEDGWPRVGDPSSKA
jgi:hypothetical protein